MGCGASSSNPRESTIVDEKKPPPQKRTGSRQKPVARSYSATVAVGQMCSKSQGAKAALKPRNSATELGAETTRSGRITRNFRTPGTGSPMSDSSSSSDDDIHTRRRPIRALDQAPDARSRQRSEGSERKAQHLREINPVADKPSSASPNHPDHSDDDDDDSFSNSASRRSPLTKQAPRHTVSVSPRDRAAKRSEMRRMLEETQLEAQLLRRQLATAGAAQQWNMLDDADNDDGSDAEVVSLTELDALRQRNVAARLRVIAAQEAADKKAIEKFRQRTLQGSRGEKLARVRAEAACLRQMLELEERTAQRVRQQLLQQLQSQESETAALSAILSALTPTAPDSR